MAQIGGGWGRRGKENEEMRAELGQREMRRPDSPPMEMFATGLSYWQQRLRGQTVEGGKTSSRPGAGTA